VKIKPNQFPSQDEFCVRDCKIAGEDCVLVFPHQIGVKWNNQNKIFRSSIWTVDGKLISAGFRKFTNVGEQPEFEPVHEKGKISFIGKKDGSCLIISKFKNQLIVRTRGTVDAESTMENGHEISFLKQKYSKVFDNRLLNSESYSILCEWYSPLNKIVEREADEPTLWLIGIVRHEDYSYLTQDQVDEVAEELEVPRPERHDFNTIEEMVSSVKEWKKGEGIVLYANNDQVLKKAKADRYLYIHRIKSKLNSEDNFIEYYVSSGMPDYESFYKKIEEEFDWELAESYRGQISRLCDAGKVVEKIVNHMKEFVKEMRHFSTRKEQAAQILSAYGQTNRSSFVFSLLDGKDLTGDQKMKIMYQVLKNKK
jgi:hypothetical protein